MKQSPAECEDCKEPWPASYMVTNEVWRDAWPEYLRDKRLAMMKYKHSGSNKQYLVLCLKCLEKRLGRPLRLSDFMEVRVNDPIRLGFEMAKRAV